MFLWIHMVMKDSIQLPPLKRNYFKNVALGSHPEFGGHLVVDMLVQPYGAICGTCHGESEELL